MAAVRLGKAVAQDLSDDLVARSRHMAEIGEGDWGAVLDAADALDAAIASAGIGAGTVVLPVEVEEMARSLDLM